MTAYNQRIVPHLWYDKEAREAAEFYASVFPRSSVSNVTTLHDTPSGDCDVVSFSVWDHQFMAISAGPMFKFTPAISVIVNFDPLLFGDSASRDDDARCALDTAWAKLSQDGSVLMPLDKYPFSERYGWVQDKYGLSWQLILTNPEGEPRPPIVPAMLFTGSNCGRAEEAMDFYLSVFKDARRGNLVRYPAGYAPEREGTIMFADFALESSWFAIMDSARAHASSFNEAISLIVNCDRQEEIDYYWEKLSAVPEAEQCGWLKDRFGVSWQVVPSDMNDMLRKGNHDQITRVTQAFLGMKKFDVAALQRAYHGT